MIPCMQKEAKMLLLTGSLVAAGLVVSFLGNALAVEGLMQFEKELDAEEYTVTVDMYTQNKNTGVFAITTRDGSDENDYLRMIVQASLITPHRNSYWNELLPIATVIGITVS